MLLLGMIPLMKQMKSPKQMSLILLDMRTGEQQWPGVVYTFEKDYQRNITRLKKNVEQLKRKITRKCTPPSTKPYIPAEHTWNIRRLIRALKWNVLVTNQTKNLRENE